MDPTAPSEPADSTGEGESPGAAARRRGGELKIVVGLGNPGAEYRHTRHNLGFLAVDAFAAALAFGRPRRRFRSRLWLGEGGTPRGRIALLEPQTYMNRSGPAVRDAIAFLLPGLLGEQGVDLADVLLVVHDDLALPPGKLRFRRRGSSGGHRGVASLIAALGTDRFSRLKIGIGHPGGDPEALAVEDWVLEPMVGDDAELLRRSAAVAAAALPTWLDEGVDVCADRFNSAAGAPEEPGAAGTVDE